MKGPSPTWVWSLWRFGRNGRWRLLAVGILVPLAAPALGAWGAAGKRQPAARRSVESFVRVARHHRAATGRRPVAHRRTRTIEVGSGATVKRFEVSEPAGVIRLLRIAVPRGTRGTLTGVIPDLAGVSISTPRSTWPSETCWQDGLDDVCSQAEEACPMPAATWHFVLRKLAGPAGEVRLEFVVG